MSDPERLDALERRVADLERLLHREPTPPQTPDPDTFWALEGLIARVGDPGAVMITGHVALPDGRAARWQETAGTEDLLDGDWSQHVAALAALAHPARIRLLQHVLHGAATAQDLTRLDGMGTSGQVYHHLRQLVAAGWLQTIGGGRYEVPVARIIPLLTTIQGARR
ncbi:helix-turn-helix domain-containing protein [Actinoplanes utahensis]|uniref:ArsR family transcriptional regulator n=1 Tax=Actinoplanes utahensis TaxID=1869 RepID=A0A0A6UFJ5_ACTUT|nr:helix-turn-helix domain-containing protein [Actinoplanes utahensis]KHD74231.1 ArsR family transcriptional regulator [Actinoplanes utahensis]GIF35453.1 transcriptional regulator [Actinoplanes utahensis]